MSTDEHPGLAAIRLSLGIVAQDERAELEAYAREHGYAPNVNGQWRRAPRKRRPDPEPISGEINTCASNADARLTVLTKAADVD